jgi:hypothetical protein
MLPVEGVVKYREEYTPSAPLERALVAELGVWRRLMWDLGLVGQDPARYDGAILTRPRIRLSTMRSPLAQ